MNSVLRQRITGLLAATLLAIVGGAAWYVLRPAGVPDLDDRTPPSASADGNTQPRPSAASATAEAVLGEPAKKRGGAPPERPALETLPRAPLENPADRSPLADELNRPQNTPGRDLEIVYSLFTAYRERFGGIPTGEDNATIVNALTGNNPQRLAFIDRSHPAINVRGEIVDRWGTPLFFHIESRNAWEIRSAGPDMEMYTADDLRKKSPAVRGSGETIPEG